MRIDHNRVSDLLERARRDVDLGILPSCQIALGFENEIVVHEAFGDTTATDSYCIFSATKPIVAASMWQLFATGCVGLDDRVVEHIPEFGRHGKEAVTVKQVMVHAGGFPGAPLPAATWSSHVARVEAMAEWTLDWEPGSQWEYHPVSAHWVLAAIIENAAMCDFRDHVHRTITEPMGLDQLLGAPVNDAESVHRLRAVGELCSPEEFEETMGFAMPIPDPDAPKPEVTQEFLYAFDQPDVRVAGVPGAGGVANAADVATVYQHFLHDPNEIFDPEWLATGTGQVINRLRDPAWGMPANRTNAFVVAGDDEFTRYRGMGTNTSTRTFGHAGAAGQLAWADPDSGLSFGYLTDGDDQNMARQMRRSHELCQLAAVCGVS